MGYMYSSAIGTVVLQVREVPPRPASYDGALCLFGLKDGADEPMIKAALGSIGQILSCEIGEAGSFPPAIVRFATHDMALAVKRIFAGDPPAELLSLCKGVDTLYNEHSYDGRSGDPTREDDQAKGVESE